MTARAREAMTVYFAYGANLDRVGMARRCPLARELGPARLEAHRFIVMADGYATVVPHPGAVVHGLLWEVDATGLLALDAYEDIEGGLYRRVALTVIAGSGPLDAAVYLATSAAPGAPWPGYMEAVVSAAVACALPEDYIAEMRRWIPSA